MRVHIAGIAVLLQHGLLAWALGGEAQPAFQSHPPLRPLPRPTQRPLADGPGYYVDPLRGDDHNAGTREAPWKTIGRGLNDLKAGDTLYLHGGVYYENVALRLAGTEQAPIVLRSVPGELAVIDGGLPEFFQNPAESWEPFEGGAAGEYRSVRRYPNLRNVVGSFGDSMVGLNTYYHAIDLRADDEHVQRKPDQPDIEPLYCGPGIWYDRHSGHLHCRLAHTHVNGFDNYRGQTDPRQVPLVIAPFRSVPLHADGARHVRFEDLVIRGGGYNTVLLDQCTDIQFDNCTIYCGTYGLRVIGTQRLRMYRCGVYGNGPPWGTRIESSLRTYPGRSERDITRYNTHAWLIPDANGEFDVYAFPFNDDWEIAWCDFTDAGADGLYLGGVSVRFHHNLVENTTDDGVYLSPMYVRYDRFLGQARLELYENIFRRAYTMLAFGGTEPTTDVIYFYRNLVDLRGAVRTSRPSEPGAKAGGFFGQVMGDHGSPPWPSMFIYHNTFVCATRSRYGDFALLNGATKERPRRLFNNILLHGGGLAGYRPGNEFAQADGNLYWAPGLEPAAAEKYLGAFRASPAFAASKAFYPPGLDAHSLVADPQFVQFQLDENAANDYRLRDDSPAVDSGVPLPADWPDTRRGTDQGKPDIGALPLGAEPLKAGRAAAPQP